MSSKTEGTVKWHNNDKGFAVNESGEDVFIQYRSFMSDQEYKTLAEGQRIAFIQVKSEKGWQVAEVEVLETA